ACAIHFFTHDLLDLAQRDEAQRHPRVKYAAELLDEPRAEHQLLADDFRLRGRFLERRDVETRNAHGAVFVGKNSIVPDGSPVTVRLCRSSAPSLAAWKRRYDRSHPSDRRFSLKISLILPLFDRRNAGWKPLQSAVSQTLDRSQYEVIAVVGRTFTDELANDAHAADLLQGCDAVVHVDADPDRLDQEIPFLLAGYERSVGDVLLFLEGHSEIDKNGCAMIAAYFRDNPQSQIAWAPRVHRSKSSLGLLVGMHSKRHERRAREQGGFWLGGNSIITRELFEHMGRLEARYMRFAERVFFERVVREKIAIGRLAMPLSTHYDDMPVSQLIGIAAAAGEARFRYYNFA